MLNRARNSLLGTGLAIAGVLAMTGLSVQAMGPEKAAVNAFSALIVGTAAFWVAHRRMR